MAEYICLAVVQAAQNVEGMGAYRVEGLGQPIRVNEGAFEANFLKVEDGTGDALKAVAAMAMAAALNGTPLPYPVTETDAQKGVLNEDHYAGVAALCHDVVRQWRRNKGVSLMAPEWAEASKGQRQVAVQAVKHVIDEQHGFPPGVLDIMELSLYKTIIGALLR